MHPDSRPTTTTFLARGVLSGLAGTVLMTVFQRLAEMPLTRRDDSFAPANAAEKLLSVRRRPWRDGSA